MSLYHLNLWPWTETDDAQCTCTITADRAIKILNLKYGGKSVIFTSLPEHAQHALQRSICKKLNLPLKSALTL
jgi:hypothetical protein